MTRPQVAAGEPAPRVSVIVPAYNYARYLPAALDSALAQDHPSFEVVVVDDGSTDETPAVLAGYADRVRVVRQANAGVNAATSTGIAAARGRYLTFLDADDTWPSGRLTALGRALDAHPGAGIAYGDMQVVDEAGTVTIESFRAVDGMRAESGRPLGRLLLGNFVSAGAMMVRASLRERFHPIPAHAGYHDWWIVTQVCAAADLVAIPDVVNHYRQHESNRNLGVDHAGLIKLAQEELPLRRHLVATVDPRAVELATLVRAGSALDLIADRLSRTGIDVDALVAPDRDAAMGALEAASAALAGGDLPATAAALVRSAAHDLGWVPPRQLLREILGMLKPGGGVPVAA